MPAVRFHRGRPAGSLTRRVPLAKAHGPRPVGLGVAANRGLFVVIACVLLHAGAQFAVAQFAVGGVYVDAEGMLRQTSSLTPDEHLELLRAESYAPPGSADVNAVSQLRKVSLRRLEERVRALHAAGKPLPADVRYLAGLTQVRYVFIYPDAKDVVIAGPAEGWKQLPTGEVVGIRSNRPPLCLDDLIVALRYAFDEPVVAGSPDPGTSATAGLHSKRGDLRSTESGPVGRTTHNRGPTHNRDPFIGCSIEPTAEGLQNYAAYMRKLGRIDRSRVGPIFAGMEQAMGPQAVKLYGVSGTSRFALKLVAADYRLKRIALGHDPSPVKRLTNYLDLMAKRLRGGPQRQHRWWLLAEYDAVYHTADELAFELEGHGVRVATAPTAAATTAGSSNDDNSKPPAASPAAKQFATSMTRHYPAAAARIPVFAELQNLIALSVAAELISQRSETDADSWKPAAFLDDKSCPVAREPVPAFVPSLANYRLVNNRHWLISISGGVEINPQAIAGRSTRKQSPPTRKLEQTHNASRAPETGDRWWWD